MLALYTWYHQLDMETLFSDYAHPVKLLENRITQIGQQLVCLAIIGKSPAHHGFPRPSMFRYVPPLTSAPEDADQQKDLARVLHNRDLRTHLFVRLITQSRYLFVGQLSLSGVTRLSETNTIHSIMYSLSPKLGRKEWYEFGAFTDWLLRAGENREYNLVTQEDLDLAVEREFALDRNHLLLTRYEEDFLSILINGEKATACYTDPATTTMLSSVRKQDSAPSTGVNVMFFDPAGREFEIPAENVISKQAARTLIKRVFLNPTRAAIGEIVAPYGGLPEE